ncbi:MAG: acyl-CoA dehydratase activase-related protein [Firmicutes bacterium]|jgi:predicted nucleotide-binding protein (sugar kinase/HSP70/actin superfamily)|nr:acyl-CoA dehydratase activase-related protein [Bacillota bacterium]
MAISVGIPRGLLYYEFYPLWEEFLETLGVRVVVSPPTNKAIVDLGVKSCVDEVCLPVKVFMGHAAYLDGRVDALFVPRVVSVERRSFICPKMMGLPDMVRARLQCKSRVIDTCVDRSRGDFPFAGNLLRLGREFGAGPYETIRAFRRGLRRMGCEAQPAEVLSEADEAATGQVRVGVLGHPYNLKDAFVSMNLLDKLRTLGARPVTADDYPAPEVVRWARKGRKRLFWTLAEKLLGAAVRWIETSEVDGIVYLTSFGCGPESFVAELVSREASRHSGMPFLLLNIDEHTGEAGLITRLEAFMDTAGWRAGTR